MKILFNTQCFTAKKVLPFISLTSFMTAVEASVTISDMRSFPTILSNNFFKVYTSMLVETPPVCRLSVTSMSTITSKNCSIRTYTQYFALWPGESFLPSPHKTSCSLVMTFQISDFISSQNEVMDGIM